MNSLLTRTLSAILATILIFGLYYFWGNDGLKFSCMIAVIICGLELTKLLFNQNEPMLIKFIFYVFILKIFIVTALEPQFSALAFAFFSVSFFCLALIMQKKFIDLHTLEAFQAKSILGFFYVGLLPGFACRLLFLNEGTHIFFSMLAIVFSGDIFAYLVGSKFGKRKLMPTVSPKKSIEGSIGGLIGSILASVLMMGALGYAPIWINILLGLFVGIFGQFGDLFESLIKRVANVKDSGNIMPGHGGVLDRIDGVLFASPIMLVGATLIQKLFS